MTIAIIDIKIAIAILSVKRACSGSEPEGDGMRVTKEKAAENRARILGAAARLFRERGLSGVGVDALGEAAGMTHGSLYSQFGSKERLAAEALAEALSRSASKAALEDAAPGEGALRGLVARYL